MVNTGGYKADNGFRSGYLTHLEAALKVSLPESGLLGKPHIESRIKTMKKDWQAVFDMLNSTSGFGYDKENNCVTTTSPGVWDAYLESHKSAAKWKNKKLPHYEDLCVVFGKDRAQGNRAKVATEMEEQVNIEEQQEDSHDSFDESMEGSHTARTTTSFQVGEVSSVPSKKRKSTSQTSSLVESFNDAVMFFGERLKESSAELSEGIKLEVDLSKKTAMLPLALEKMTSLSQRERFKAIRKIRSDSDSVLTFWDLKEEERESWVLFMMSEN
uniref:uncharacterized protein At2g29880-like n=1 Tax=Erigeron canadensis TaxID=72917 RepID=UPI001CB93DE5|nr:uncharacterized protein At2g29880-like [Erigeron canadensis]